MCAHLPTEDCKHFTKENPMFYLDISFVALWLASLMRDSLTTACKKRTIRDRLILKGSAALCRSDVSEPLPNTPCSECVQSGRSECRFHCPCQVPCFWDCQGYCRPVPSFPPFHLPLHRLSLYQRETIVYTLFKSLGVLRFFYVWKELSFAHQGCNYLNKNTAVLINIPNENNCFSILTLT